MLGTVLGLVFLVLGITLAIPPQTWLRVMDALYLHAYPRWLREERRRPASLALYQDERLMMRIVFPITALAIGLVFILAS